MPLAQLLTQSLAAQSLVHGNNSTHAGSPHGSPDDHKTYIYKYSISTCGGHHTPSIHGLWPEWDMNCHGADYDHDAVKDLIPEMEKNW